MTNLIILCLPFIQIIFIRLFYFKRGISGASSLVIIVSFAAWVFVVFRYIRLSYKERSVTKMTKNRPFIDSIPYTKKPFGLTKIRSIKLAAKPDKISGGHRLQEFYKQPPWTESCSRDYKNKISDDFKLERKLFIFFYK